VENLGKIDLENLDREDLEYGVEAAKQILKEYEAKLQQVIEQEAIAKEAELDPTAGVEVPEDYVYVLLETNDLQIHNIGEDICYECAEDLSRLGLIRDTAYSAYVSARRNIRGNRLEALAHSIGGAYEFEFGEENYCIVINAEGDFSVDWMDKILEPEKIYMTKETADKVMEILNSGTYKLNLDVTVEDDDICEECDCDACCGNDC
jgi:hypothetical protein